MSQNPRSSSVVAWGRRKKSWLPRCGRPLPPSAQPSASSLWTIKRWSTPWRPPCVLCATFESSPASFAAPQKDLECSKWAEIGLQGYLEVGETATASSQEQFDAFRKELAAGQQTDTTIRSTQKTLAFRPRPNPGLKLVHARPEMPERIVLKLVNARANLALALIQRSAKSSAPVKDINRPLSSRVFGSSQGH
ncbi:hypothetical protein EDB81DRAFT_883768 [Dactylonectria macrodidyma]|uniref:Uncharacterized protein n=1 Tax=Dactylonectria macrodidyma TaxID=307937 RepID=A0A9P9J7P3_9HYPO|nr:hypothetical protein EDB81DRAFT_883768 [Dactylonectria macrodidyma]